MTPAFAEIVAEIENRYRPGVLVSLLLDFDGTLVPISPDPAAPVLDAATRETLALISGKPSFVTSIISGRAVEDLYSRICMSGLIYAGNHGLEIFGRSLCFVEPVAAALREKLERLTEDLTSRLQPVAGAAVENKGLTISVHYRNVAEPDVATVQNAVCAAIHEQAVAPGSFRANAGRKVVNIVPETDWHKGAAARWINRHLGWAEDDILSIYVGDDSTDEDAFSTLTEAITVKVGGCPTQARYRLPDPKAVHELLRWLADFDPQLPEPLAIATVQVEGGDGSSRKSPS